MGSDKALLQLEGQTLLERTLGIARAAAPHVAVVGPRQLYCSYAVTIEDFYPNCGPLSGIHAALNATRTDQNLILSVDMPAMTSEFLVWLRDRASACDELAVVPNVAGGLQPLCAVYRRELRLFAEEALQREDYKIGKMLSLAPVRYISGEEIAAGGFTPEIFCNVNTREEYEAVTQGKQPHLFTPMRSDKL